MANPDQIESYSPGLFWTKDYFQRGLLLPNGFNLNEANFKEVLLVPMDSRTTASPTGNTDYVFYREGGWSWAIPYIAGLYALAC